jgi:hypothetical protein
MQRVAWLLLILLLAGCQEPTVQVRSLPCPSAEQPPANLPAALHQRNKLGPQGQGSCVHASLVSHLRWCNQAQLAARWWSTYGDGEFDSRLRARLDAANVDYVYTLRADPRFLDWCSGTRRGCILWWKPSHCCTFMGWVKQANGREYAAILDNNSPGRFELTEREQFIRLWAGYGGFGLSVCDPPASSLTYRSYEVVP